MSIFIVGCGYLGERVAKKLSSRESDIHVLTRQPERQARFTASGWHAHLGDWLDPKSLVSLPAVDTLLIAVTHRAVEGIEPTQTHVQGLKNLWQALPSTTTLRVIYISTTGVFSQDDGQWVDEKSPCEPSRPGGLAALHAEQWLTQNVTAHNLTILRMAGLYGPDRIPNAERMRLKMSLANADDSFLNLIHIDDAVGFCLEAIEHPHPESLYLVADGSPIPRREYYQFLVDLLQISDHEGPSTPPAATPTARRSESNKRINTALLHRDFSYRCRYSDYRDGVRASCQNP